MVMISLRASPPAWLANTLSSVATAGVAAVDGAARAGSTSSTKHNFRRKRRAVGAIARGGAGPRSGSQMAVPPPGAPPNAETSGDGTPRD